MIGFAKRIATLIIVLVIMAYALDAIYTAIYNSASPRTKTQYVMQLNKTSYDAIFMGSSRVENHIKTKVFKDNDLKAINLGMSGANLNENLLTLKLLIDKGVTAQKIFIQMDHNFENEAISKGVTASFLPFINDSVVASHYKQQLDSYWVNKNIPFYRYAVNDAKIGLREITMNIFGKKPRVPLDDGYIPLLNSMKQGSYNLPNQVSDVNKIYNKIEKLKSDNNLNIIYFTAPFCENTKNINYFDELKEKHIPELHDYSRLFNDDNMFDGCGHLNDKGAEKFTNKILGDFYGKK